MFKNLIESFESDAVESDVDKSDHIALMQIKDKKKASIKRKFNSNRNLFQSDNFSNFQEVRELKLEDDTEFDLDLNDLDCDEYCQVKSKEIINLQYKLQSLSSLEVNLIMSMYEGAPVKVGKTELERKIDEWVEN